MQQLMVSFVLCFCHYHAVDWKPDLIQIVPCKQTGWLKPSDIWSKNTAFGAWCERVWSSRRGWKQQHDLFSVWLMGAFAGLEMFVYFMGWKNLSTKHVCLIKLLNHWLNYSYSVLFNPLVRVEAANANTKRNVFVCFVFGIDISNVTLFLYGFHFLFNPYFYVGPSCPE